VTAAKPLSTLVRVAQTRLQNTEKDNPHLALALLAPPSTDS
jgi:hypothetical protein